MSQALGITVDQTTYRVGIQYESLKRTFEIKEGSGKTSAISGKVVLDPIGLYYSYKLTFRSLLDYQTDYDALFLALSQPVYSHEITLPFGQRLYTFNAMIESGSDKYEGLYKFKPDNIQLSYGAYHHWDELEIKFTPVNPVSQLTIENLLTDLGGT